MKIKQCLWITYDDSIVFWKEMALPTRKEICEYFHSKQTKLRSYLNGIEITNFVSTLQLLLMKGGIVLSGNF